MNISRLARILLAIIAGFILWLAGFVGGFNKGWAEEAKHCPIEVWNFHQ